MACTPIYIIKWLQCHGKAKWLDEQNKLSFASNQRNFAYSIHIKRKKLNTYQSWKIGSEEKDCGAKHWHQIAHNKHHFPEIVPNFHR